MGSTQSTDPTNSVNPTAQLNPAIVQNLPQEQGLPQIIPDKPGTAYPNVTLEFGSGIQEYYTANTGSPGNYFSPGNDLGTLVASSGLNPTYTYTSFNGETEQFDASGHLTRSADRNNVGSTYTYDGSGKLTAIYPADGSTYTFAYDSNGYISEIYKLVTTVPATLQITTLTHDTSNPENLMSVNWPDRTFTTFTYDTNRLTVIQDDGVITTIAYDTNGIVSQIYDTSGTYTVDTPSSTSMYGYDGTGATRLATVTDPLNRTTTYRVEMASMETAPTAWARS